MKDRWNLDCTVFAIMVEGLIKDRLEGSLCCEEVADGAGRDQWGPLASLRWRATPALVNTLDYQSITITITKHYSFIKISNYVNNS